MNKDVENSMFDEFKNVTKTFERLSKANFQGNYPAMIILERNLIGKNSHAMIGQPEDLVTLFEWAIHLLCEAYEMDFDDFMKAIELKHKETDHLMLQDIKEEI